MKKMNYTDFSKYLFGLTEIFNIELTPIAIELCYDSLKEYDIKEIKQAIMNILKTELKMFAGVNIANLIENRINPINEKADKQALQVIKAISDVGSYRYPKFDDPVTQYIIDNHYNWKILCLTLTDNVKWVLKEFVEKYRMTAKDKIALEYKPKMIEEVQTNGT